jgi:hypothetical protein
MLANDRIKDFMTNLNESDLRRSGIELEFEKTIFLENCV